MDIREQIRDLAARVEELEGLELAHRMLAIKYRQVAQRLARVERGQPAGYAWSQGTLLKIPARPKMLDQYH